MVMRLKSLPRTLIPFCFLLCLFLETTAQTSVNKGILQGQIRFNNGQPAKNALVIVSGGYQKVNTRTDFMGEFKLTLPRGQWKVVAVVDGYKRSDAEGTVTAGRTNYISPNPIVLNPESNQSSSNSLFRKNGPLLARVDSKIGRRPEN